MSLDDARRDRQPEARAADFMIATSASDKRFEDAVEDILRDARAVIFDGDLDVFGLQ